MQTAIYTIAKNEAHNVAAFMKAAEGVPVYVLDTGSTDDTVELLKKHGANVEQQIITPWRFDSARNAALEMIPSSVDYCVSLDMDEVIQPGWQEKLKEEWKGNIGNYLYIGAWKDKEKTQPICIGPRTRLHTRAGFTWERHIHEVIAPIQGTSIDLFDTTVLVKHYQNNIQRNYNPALDIFIKDNPRDVNSRIQRASEHVQKGNYKKALKDYLKANSLLVDKGNNHQLSNKKAVTLLAAAFCYHKLNDLDSCFKYCMQATACDPYVRETWMYLAKVAGELGNLDLAYGAAKMASRIKTFPPYITIDGQFWGENIGTPRNFATQLFKTLSESEEK